MSLLKRIFSRITKVQKAKIVLLGPSKAGKTTLVRYLEQGQPVLQEVRTTLGIDLREKPFVIDNWEFTAIDVGGQELYKKAFWKLGMDQADAIIYMIDGLVGSKHPKFHESLKQFQYMINLVGYPLPLLILVNKQDLVDENPLSIEETISLYKLNEIKNLSYIILPSSAKYGTGVEKAFKWLVDRLEDKSGVIREEQNIFINNFGFFEITRDKVQFTVNQGFGSLEEKILAEAIPFGEPCSKSIKLSKIEDEFYLSISRFDFDKDLGYGIIFRYVFPNLNFAVKEFVVNRLFEIISSQELLNEIAKENILHFKTKKVDSIFRNFELPNLDGIIFSILTQIPIIVFGENEEIMDFLMMLIRILPNWALNKYTFVTQTTSLTENVTMIGLKPTEENLEMIERRNDPHLPVIHLTKNKVFAPFTSKICIDFAKEIEMKSDRSSTKILDDFYELITSNNDIDSVSVVISRLNLKYNDAQLFIGIKKAQEGEPINPREIDEMI
ncbi:MAG TPA: ADP-ribosylation factor-like protein [candidate division Zixibacteria bacterium]|nr:ADP-ribosylation factor-like protein [candidate division Zixibacteria bacterium]